MWTPTDAQRTHNETSVVSVDEALWRLRLAPTAAELVTLIPAAAVVDEHCIDLFAL